MLRVTPVQQKWVQIERSEEIGQLIVRSTVSFVRCIQKCFDCYILLNVNLLLTMYILAINSAVCVCVYNIS